MASAFMWTNNINQPPEPVYFRVGGEMFKSSIDTLVAIVYKIKYKPGYWSCDLLKNSIALIGGKFIFRKRFALQSECCNFNQ